MNIPPSIDIPFIVLGLWLLVASIIDIKTHEVPDWLSYSLIVLGVLFGIGRGYTRGDWWYALWPILGIALGYAVGALLYYTGQWGGGDAKLLMGVGSVLGLNGSYFTQILPKGLIMPAPALAWFLIFLLVGGAVYGIIWMLVLILIRWKRFVTPFREHLREMKRQRILIWIISAVLIICAIVSAYQERAALPVLFIILAAIIYGSFYLIAAVRVVEKALMHRPTKIAALVEGDWIVGGVKVGKRWIVAKKNIGITNEQIALLRRLAPKKIVTVRHGIPFVPSFLIAYGALILLASL